MSQNLKLHPLRIAVGLILLVAIMQPSFVTGQNTSSENKSQQPAASGSYADSLSLDELRAKRSVVEASQNLDKEHKTSALAWLDKAIGFSELTDELNRQSEILSQQIKSAPLRIKNIHAELAKPFDTPKGVKTMAAKKDALELQQRLQKEQAQLTAAKDLLAGWDDQLTKQRDLLQLLPKNIADAKALLKMAGENLKSPPTAGDPTEITESHRLRLGAERLKLNAQIKVYEQQLNSHELLVSLFRAESDLAARKIAEREELIKAWQVEASERVQEEAAQARQEAEEARDKTPESAAAVKEEYDINIALSAELEELTLRVTAVNENLDKVSNRHQELEEDFTLATERVENLVLTEAIGLALRRQRQMLPRADKYRQRSAERKLKMSEIREIQFQLERRRRALADIESETNKIVDSLVYLTPDKAETLRSDVQGLLTDRRQLLDKLETGYNQLFKGLQNIEFSEQQVVTRAKAYADFLDAHLVWIRSSRILNYADFKNSAKVLQALVSPNNWRLTASDTLDSVQAKPGLWILGLLFSLFFLFGRRWAHRELSRLAERVKKVRKDRFSVSLRALTLTAYLAVAFPFVFAFVAWLLLKLPGPYDFTHAVAAGMLPAAVLWATFAFIFHFCQTDNLAHIHFKWPQSARHTLQRNLKWLFPLAVLMAFLISAMSAVKEMESGDSMAKLGLIVQGTAFSIFLGWTLRFSGGIVAPILKNHPTGWLARLRYVWWPVAVGLPLLEAVLVVVGYFLSAMQLRGFFRETLLLVLFLIILNGLALRWLALARRRFAIREARRKAEEKRKELLRKQAKEKAPGAEGQEAPVIHTEHEIGLAEIDGQTRSILRTIIFILIALGLWAIWGPVFPAFGILQDIHLWSYSGMVDGVTTTIPISLANLTMAVVVSVITFIASRNLPGLLEITILNRLPMDAGARYAFTTLCRYAITAIGIIVAFNTIGFRWSRVQWLVAALGVGLGFGLQEIVANFICGLIVLFERPFRRGDTVTVGDVSGTVSRIRIRATSILDWDRKELIVPNKEFITGKLVNWSLSDPISRFIVKVGIAYGSDVELAEKILLEIINENPMVLKEPKPSVYFLGFGDNSLNFELRIFISSIDHWLPTRHELHKAIDRKFREAGIVIAFPQRDVHFDTDSPLKVQVVPDGSDTKSNQSEPEPDASE
jgi:potassium efflux system protein